MVGVIFDQPPFLILSYTYTYIVQTHMVVVFYVSVMAWSGFSARVPRPENMNNRVQKEGKL